MPAARPSPLRVSLLLAACGLVGLAAAFADGQLPPPPPPPQPAPPLPTPGALPPVTAPAKPKDVPADAPVAALDRLEHDFGVAKQETDLKTEFTLKNEGKSTLTFDLHADCGCSIPVSDVRSLEPGQSTPIRVTFRTFAMVGRQSKRVRVLSNDPARTTLEIHLKADISAGVVVDPMRFYFGQVEVGTAPSLTIKVQWKDGIGSPFKILSTEIPGLDLALSTKPFDAPPWHGYEVTAAFKSPPPVGTVSGTAIVRTDSPDVPRISAAVTAFVSGRIWLDRREISLGLLPQGKERVVSVGCRALKPGIDLGAVTAKARGGRVKVAAIRAQEEWLIEIASPEGAAPGRLDDVIDVACALPGETAEIAVKGEVLAKKD